VLTPPAGSPIEYRLAALNTVGRSEDNTIQVSAPGVSRRHARIAATTTGFVLADLESQNGTFVNDERVSEHELADGDRITIGAVDLVYRLGGSDV
jgi:pSer/pThr/pTyr-binding forkhead associated (FHA) protein